MSDLQDKIEKILSGFKLQKKIMEIQKLSFAEAEKLIYMWVKQGHVTLREFRVLCQVNRESVS